MTRNRSSCRRPKNYISENGLSILFRPRTLFRRHLLPDEIAVLLRPLAVGIGGERRTQPAISLHMVARQASSGGVHRSQPITCPGVVLDRGRFQQHHCLFATARHTIALDVHICQPHRCVRIAFGGRLPQPCHFGGGIAGVLCLGHLSIAGIYPPYRDLLIFVSRGARDWLGLLSGRWSSLGCGLSNDRFRTTRSLSGIDSAEAPNITTFPKGVWG